MAEDDNTARASINAGDEAQAGPSLEEQYQALVKEGLIAPDGDNPGDESDPVAQGGASETEEGSTDERPSWLPEKFKSPEDFAKAYAALERRMAEGGQAADDDDDDGSEGTQATPEERAAAEEATKKAGLDLGEVSKEYNANGGLSEGTYKALEDAGYPKEMVDIYIEGLTGRVNAVANEAFGIVGGEDAYGEMIEWAIDNLSPAEQEAFDTAVNSGNRFQVINAVKALKADFEAAVMAELSEEPEETVTSKGKAPANVYQTVDDYMADLNDPRYDENETFRRQVMDKLARSNIM